jgi:hypothetical protein
MGLHPVLLLLLCFYFPAQGTISILCNGEVGFRSFPRSSSHSSWCCAILVMPQQCLRKSIRISSTDHAGRLVSRKVPEQLSEVSASWLTNRQHLGMPTETPYDNSLPFVVAVREERSGYLDRFTDACGQPGVVAERICAFAKIVGVPVDLPTPRLASEP